ncbi:similar to Saccharomyces cerevisiae YIL131C FKH1 Forkhead family transcription factor with a minor role in the expression of G2/M phase genes [Maudiozyma saulgeensis]|uniref:Similar to Saccharomyces cerevisiae YIL131C FKH1 Forkhead family transcription factor with a minor role in the expression of G2/M phase genes n=1 Tax=Maudiozyma saulgeensis TaxID=1789683 RepID=A0A1X7QYY5_9SACH|nr:similar to Saccharomyces cerevisiae YIL131C FKH1 Forkhead family transcription factor with a minor role in the expression of G2/M phase genes [Kazachstania saulgeensis]
MSTYNYIYQNPHTPQEYQSSINTIISLLVEPEQPTTVMKTYANDKNLASEVQAYAKLAGRDWTFYVKNLSIIIGRNTDNVLNNSGNNNNNQILEPDSNVDIDLGPGKVVSRKHATIIFNTEKGGWELHVLGRNGAKVNFERVHTGQDYPPVKLSSGTILDIGGTQMMFILPDTEPIISDSTFEALIPRLLSVLGNSGQSNNQLLNEIIRNSIYVRTQQQQLQEVQREQRATNAMNQTRTFKMYGNSSNLPYPNGTQFIHQNLPTHSNGNGFPNGLDSSSTNLINNDFKNHSKSSSSASGSSTSSRFHNSLSINGFPHAIDFASDLSRDENKTVKPPHSYATMITQAILSSKEGIISLADIYKFIASNYAYYRFAKTGWQNSIRHNLSLNKAFEKVPRRPNEPGKGMKWRISEAFQKDFIEKWNSGNLSKIKRGSSVIRQLQLHMSKYNSLPIQRYPEQNSNNYQPEETNNDIMKKNKSITQSNNSNNKTNNVDFQLPNLPKNSNQSQIPPPQMINTTDNNGMDNLPIIGDKIKINQQNSKNLPIQGMNYQNVFQNESNKDNFNNDIKSHLESSNRGLNRSNNQNNNIHFNPSNNALVSFNNASYGSSSSGPSSTNNSNTTATTVSSLNSMDVKKETKIDNMDNNEIILPNIRASLYQNTMLPANQINLSNSTAPALNTNGSNTYDSILRSPSKSFHITAMEAYTPERGSTIQSNKSPKQETASNPNVKPDMDTLSIKNLNPRFTPSTAKSQGHVKSSPGVLNLLQFSSVNNTPKLDTLNGNGTGERNRMGNPTDNDNDSAKELVSSPIKRPDMSTDAKGSNINKDLILDTENAKVTIVNE